MQGGRLETVSRFVVFVSFDYFFCEIKYRHCLRNDSGTFQVHVHVIQSHGFATKRL